MFDGNFPPALVLLSGLPGSGKTTFARAFAQRVPCVVVESDAIRRSLTRNPTYSRQESARVFDRVESQAAKALKRGQVALVDATNLSAADRVRFVELAESEAMPFIPVRIVAPEAVILDRLAKPRTGHSQADGAIYERMKDRPELFDHPAVVVDSRFDPEPAISLIVRLMRRPAATTQNPADSA